MMEKIMRVVNKVSSVLTLFSLFSLSIYMIVLLIITFFICYNTPTLDFIFAMWVIVFFAFGGVSIGSYKWLEAFAS